MSTTTRSHVTHAKDVLNVPFHSDNQKIVSGTQGGVIKLWKNLDACNCQDERYMGILCPLVTQQEILPSSLPGAEQAGQDVESSKQQA